MFSKMAMMELESRNTIPYRPAYKRITGHTNAALFLNQAMYNMAKSDGEPFPRFVDKPKGNVLNGVGCWQEEMFFSRRELITARDKTTTRIPHIGYLNPQETDSTIDPKKLKKIQDGIKKDPMSALIFCWMDSSNVMWWWVNTDLVDEIIAWCWSNNNAQGQDRLSKKEIDQFFDEWEPNLGIYCSADAERETECTNRADGTKRAIRAFAGTRESRVCWNARFARSYSILKVLKKEQEKKEGVFSSKSEEGESHADGESPSPTVQEKAEADDLGTSILTTKTPPAPPLPAETKITGAEGADGADVPNDATDGQETPLTPVISAEERLWINRHALVETYAGLVGDRGVITPARERELYMMADGGLTAKELAEVYRDKYNQKGDFWKNQLITPATIRDHRPVYARAKERAEAIAGANGGEGETDQQMRERLSRESREKLMADAARLGVDVEAIAQRMGG